MFLTIALIVFALAIALPLLRPNAPRTPDAGDFSFHVLVDAIPTIVWTAKADGHFDFLNQEFFTFTGMKREPIADESYAGAIHPDDIPVRKSAWERAIENGTTYAVEYRFRRADGSYRWFLAKGNPVRDEQGQIVKWVGTCTDIDEQMSHQQVLEEQVKQHTAALLEANARLESEMSERALAQQELNQQNDRMLRELTLRSNRATTLAKMAELLQSCADLKDVFAVVSGMAQKIFPDFAGAVLLFNSSRDALEVAASWAGCQLVGSVFGPLDCWALRTGHLHLVTAGDHTAECRHAGSIAYAYFCLPLLSQGEAIGIVHFQCNANAELPESILVLASTFADQVGLSVSNLRLREALRSQSIRDPLTGLFNRRYLEETLEREIRRAVRSEQSLGVLMLDLDHFKTFNDTYGHDAGDTVLREAASFLTKSVRAEDIVCRFGGEEFVIILPMADLKATQARAERIRSKLRELVVLHQGQSVGLVTVSLGVAALPDHGTSPRVLIDAADAALYRAKREGRDRVMVAEAVIESEVKLPRDRF